MATPVGTLPTVIGADTAPVAVVITETVPSSRFATYACLPSGATATPSGPWPTAMGTDGESVADLNAATVPSPMLVTYAFPAQPAAAALAAAVDGTTAAHHPNNPSPITPASLRYPAPFTADLPGLAARRFPSTSTLRNT